MGLRAGGIGSESGTLGRREDGSVERAISWRAVPGLAMGETSCDDPLPLTLLLGMLYKEGVLLSVYNCLLLSLFGMNFNGV